MSERQYAMPHDLPVAVTPLAGTELAMFEQDGQLVQTPYSDLAGAVSAHAASHQHLGSDEIATEDVIAHAIPKLDSSGRIDTRVSDASTTKKGKVQLATDGEEDATKAVNGLDSRLSDARYPEEHASSHVGGADPIPVATASNDGLMTSTHVQTLADLSAVSFENLPTAGEKAALAGSYGTPSDTNRYITENDPIIASIEGIPVGVPVPVCDDAPALESPFEPMNGQLISDAGSVFNGRRLRNMNGASVFLDLTFTADAGGAYAEIDESDTPAIGLHDWIIGTGIADHSWISDIGLTEPVATSQTVRDYWSLEYHNDELYCTVLNDNIYKMDEYGVFQTTSQASLDWHSIKSFNGELYATVQGVSGNVYKMDEYGVFQTTSQTPGGYQDLFIHNDELYCIVTGSGSGIYKMDALGVFSSFLSITGVYEAVSYEGLIVYQTQSINNIMCYNGTGHYLFATQSAAEKAQALRVIDGTLFKIDDYSLCMYEGGGTFKAMTAIPINNTRDVILVGDTLYIATISSPGDVYTIDYSKRLLTISDPSATGATYCTFSNEGRGIIGGEFGSVGDQGQKITGSLSVSGIASLFDTPVVAGAGALHTTKAPNERKQGDTSGTFPNSIIFDSADSPYARTSDDTWGKTKTDAYKLKYYVRIK